MTVQNPRDVRLFSLCDDRIGVAAYNSCHGNDCLLRRSSVSVRYVTRQSATRPRAKNLEPAPALVAVQQ